MKKNFQCSVQMDVLLHLLSSDEGGRIDCITTGYRPSIEFGESGKSDPPNFWLSEVSLKAQNVMWPGEVGEAIVTLLLHRDEDFPTGLSGEFRAESELILREGNRKTGTAKVISIISVKIEDI